MKKVKRGFASDNNSGVHPEVMQAIQSVNKGHVIGYGDDEYTDRAVTLVKKHFGKEAQVFFVFNGTGANVLSCQAATRPFNSIICAETSHLHEDECGAPEKFTGCKVLTVPSRHGKISVPSIEKLVYGIGFEHHSQPRIISITQATELGTVYSLSEIRVIADYAHENNMILHMDGARLSNAVVHLDSTFRLSTADQGVDILSFGLTKNGGMLCEAVIFFNPDLVPNFKYIRKQGMQLGSKMRFISAQFIALLQNDLWKRNAYHANSMARLLAERLAEFPQIKITHKVEANGVFVIVPPAIVSLLREKFFFYYWNENISEIRLMTSFDTAEDDITGFIAELRSLLGQ
ncbi:MAG: low specificity L-threonine aldolase [Candidatus Cloacimonetes bacterium]|nr:low specificity L-threonine aldolase [Candidatus Cloacimonadota bacterium]